MVGGLLVEHIRDCLGSERLLLGVKSRSPGIRPASALHVSLQLILNFILIAFSGNLHFFALKNLFHWKGLLRRRLLHWLRLREDLHRVLGLHLVVYQGLLVSSELLLGAHDLRLALLKVSRTINAHHVFD